MEWNRRVALPALLCFLVFAAGCSSADVVAQTTTVVSTAQTETSVAEPEPVPTTEPPTGGSASGVDIPTLLDAGPWTLDLGTLAIELVSDEPMDVDGFASGELLLGLPDLSSFHGFGVFELKSLISATTGGVMIERLRPVADLGPWLDSLDAITVLESGEAEMAGSPASWWRFDVGESCPSCFQPLYSAGRGVGAGVYGTVAGLGWQIFTIELEDRVIAITLEAPVDEFDEFASRMQPLLDSLEIEAQPGESVWQSKDRPFASGRVELVVRDETRTTPAVASVGAVGTEVQDERSILVSLLYPSDEGGWDAAPADGAFPLILLAPGLSDFGTVSPLDLRLAQAGYVVARLRYPGSSWPGEIRQEIDEQPRDTSLVLDALLGDGLPSALAATVDPERIGAVGLSMGGTTIYGLLGAACCHDTRIDAAVAHAPTTYDFGGELRFSDVPLLIITSESDAFAPPPAVVAVQDLSPSSISSFVLASGTHLAWLLPTSPDYEAMIRLTQHFLDTHVAGIETDQSIINGFDGEWTPAQSE